MTKMTNGRKEHKKWVLLVMKLMKLDQLLEKLKDAVEELTYGIHRKRRKLKNI